MKNSGVGFQMTDRRIQKHKKKHGPSPGAYHSKLHPKQIQNHSLHRNSPYGAIPIKERKKRWSRSKDFERHVSKAVVVSAPDSRYKLKTKLPKYNSGVGFSYSMPRILDYKLPKDVPGPGAYTVRRPQSVLRSRWRMESQYQIPCSRMKQLRGRSDSFQRTLLNSAWGS